MNLIVEDDSRIFTMYFCMSEDNLRKQIKLPWVSFCSDAELQAPEAGVPQDQSASPRLWFIRAAAGQIRA